MPFLSEALYQNLVRGAVDDAPISVHLTEYPSADESVIDAELLEAMEAAQRVVALGRAARERAKIRVRQPLPAMYVRTPGRETDRDLAQLQEIILAELNVKELRFAQTEDEFVAYDVRPNLPVLGPRYGKRLRGIQEALRGLDPAVIAHTVERGEPVCLSLDGESVELAPEDVLIDAREREGYAAMADGGFLAVLDTRLDQGLIREGLTREVVRHINEWRKGAGYEIDDRTTVRYEASPELAAAIEQYRDYVSQETLATSLVAGAPKGVGFVAEASFDGQRLTVELTKV
jgi:isoleucyl-tRNA synthetase